MQLKMLIKFRWLKLPFPKACALDFDKYQKNLASLKSVLKKLMWLNKVVKINVAKCVKLIFIH